MDKNFFDTEFKYWDVSAVIRDVYMSDGAIASLLDFERVLDEVDIYAFKNWELGELVHGPEVGRYNVTCVFMWPAHLMPDPRGAKRLLPFDCDVKFKKSTIQIPVKIKTSDDYRPGEKKARIIDKEVWFVSIGMPKTLMKDIRTGSIEIEGQSIDLADLDQAYDEDLDKEEFKADGAEQPGDMGQGPAEMGAGAPPMPGGM